MNLFYSPVDPRSYKRAVIKGTGTKDIPYSLSWYNFQKFFFMAVQINLNS